MCNLLAVRAVRLSVGVLLAVIVGLLLVAGLNSERKPGARGSSEDRASKSAQQLRLNWLAKQEDRNYADGMASLREGRFVEGVATLRLVEEVDPGRVGVREAIETGIRRNAADVRSKVAPILRNHFLDQGWDIEVEVSGVDNEHASLKWVLFSEVTARNLQKMGEFDHLCQLGFFDVTAWDGYTWGKKWECEAGKAARLEREAAAQRVAEEKARQEAEQEARRLLAKRAKEDEIGRKMLLWAPGYQAAMAPMRRALDRLTATVRVAGDISGPCAEFRSASASIVVDSVRVAPDPIVTLNFRKVLGALAVVDRACNTRDAAQVADPLANLREPIRSFRASLEVYGLTF